MALEQTLVLVKPDGVTRGLVGEVVGRIERKGYRIRALQLLALDRATAETHYAEHEGKEFYAELVEFITSGPVVALCVEGQEAIAGMRQLMGATNPLEADPGSIRGAYATDLTRNIVHGSDGHESAQRELELFFPGRFA